MGEMSFATGVCPWQVNERDTILSSLLPFSAKMVTKSKPCRSSNQDLTIRYLWIEEIFFHYFLGHFILWGEIRIAT